MIRIARWKIILILAVCAWSFLYSAPNILPPAAQTWVAEKLPSWAPSQTINLGLDLQGGSHLLLKAELDTVIKQRSEDMLQTLRPDLRKQKIGYKRIAAIPGGIRVTLRERADADAIRKILQDLDPGLTVLISDDGIVEATFGEQALKDIQTQTMEQSIEIVRRRIDETGTREPVIQRQGDDRILVQLPGIGDPESVKKLLGTTAKLTFHLLPRGADTASSGGSMTLPMRDTPGETISVQRRAMLTGDTLVNAQYAQDQNGQPAVSFRFNTTGAKRFCDLSRENVGQLFAIVLDNEIISAPVIREPICGGTGQISGSFSLKEANDLALLLRAGALPAPLKIMEERTVGPSLGADSVESGKMASIVGVSLVLVFVSLYYNLFGVFAAAALLVNLTLILAVMSILQATLTLPGIAGVVLTVGMAVDANVLIFERIREEIRAGRSAISAIDSGFKMAMATIVDSNLTTLIAAIILYSYGTGPIKGFAVTLGIGIVTSFFSSVLLTRLMVVTWLRGRKPAALPL